MPIRRSGNVLSDERLVLYLAAAMLLAAMLATDVEAADDARTLAAPESFQAIGDAAARSAALFSEAGKVLTHPRCVNCHPAGDRPLQSDAGRPHEPLVVRGADGHGAPGMRCETCHHVQNFDPAHVPGHPQWQRAPSEMSWQGKTLADSC